MGATGWCISFKELPWLDSKTRWQKLIHGQAQLVNNGDQRVSVLRPDKDTRSYDAILLACGAWYLIS